ncbi:MAG: AAA family ATPase [Actinomycetota bacterium]
MDSADDLRPLIASRHPLIVAEMNDEERFMGLARVATAAAGVPLWTWSVTRGLALDRRPPQYDTQDARKALNLIAEMEQPGVFVLADAHHALDDPVVVRQVKEMAQWGAPGKTLILTVPRPTLPPELKGLALTWTLHPPDRAELEQLVRRTLDDLAARRFTVLLSDMEIESLVEALRGLSTIEAERVVQETAFRDGAMTRDDIEEVRQAKAELLEAGGALELIEAHAGNLDQVGGLDRLKEWLRLRGRGFEPAAGRYGLEPPRGVLITGIPGCGKSLAAKTLARTWQLPLVLLDPARLYGPYIGESEQRLADALWTVEAMAPVVLWVDEIEKGFASGGEADSGVSRRVLGTFLRWMQDRPPGIFLAATCNDVAVLPPEFLRKGRFDEIFFVDLPKEAEREAIVRLHLLKRNRDPAAFDVMSLAGASEGFSGAEIEAAVVGALYRAYGEGREITTEDVLQELEATVPLAASRAEDVARLRAWAEGRAVTA